MHECIGSTRAKRLVYSGGAFRRARVESPFQRSYASISMAPLLARPAARSERWHVLCSPKDDAWKGAQEGSGSLVSPGRSSPARSSGTILLSMAFIPSGTHGINPLPPLMPTVPRSAQAPGGPSSSAVVASGERGAPRSPATRATPSPRYPVTGSAAGQGSPEVTQRVNGTMPAPQTGREHAQAVERPKSRVRDSRGGVLVTGEIGGDGSAPDTDDGPRRRDIPEGLPAGLRAGAVSSRRTEAERGSGAEDPAVVSDLPAANGSSEAVVVSDGRGEIEIASKNAGKVHMFRVKSYSSPVWCDVCQRLLLGVSRPKHPRRAFVRFCGFLFPQVASWALVMDEPCRNFVSWSSPLLAPKHASTPTRMRRLPRVQVHPCAVLERAPRWLGSMNYRLLEMVAECRFVGRRAMDQSGDTSSDAVDSHKLKACVGFFDKRYRTTTSTAWVVPDSTDPSMAGLPTHRVPVVTCCCRKVRNQGFCCEVCGMNVHPRCQLRANFAQPCPGEGKKVMENVPSSESVRDLQARCLVPSHKFRGGMRVPLRNGKFSGRVCLKANERGVFFHGVRCRRM